MPKIAEFVFRPHAAEDAEPEPVGYVHVTDDDGNVTVLAPGDEVPKWAQDRVGAHVTNSTSDSAVPSTEPVPGFGQFPQDLNSDTARNPDADTVAEAAEAQSTEDDEEGEEVPEPPRSGAGSGRDAWAAFADAVGVEYPDGATRDEIIAAYDESE